jgi:maltooligosyltrehalose trehalohydrolase
MNDHVSSNAPIHGNVMSNADQSSLRQPLPRVGAIPAIDGTDFYVWAPRARELIVLFEDGGSHTLRPDEDGYFKGTSPARAGQRYKLLVDGKGPFPDPASRYQPNGPHGWSEIVDSNAFQWSDEKNSRGKLELRDQVLYELHIGTFTREGTYLAAEQEFPRLRKLGITALEIMPVNEFGGNFGWGYDGVALFAPYHIYGTPTDLQHMIDAAHRAGLAIFLDVVYNHLGPDGNYLAQFSPFYFSKTPTEWGEAPNFDGENSKPVRDFFVQNAEYWIRDFHFDGLRFDATQSFVDSGIHGEQILTTLARSARAAAGSRQILLFSECERQESQQLVPAAKGGCGLDGMWNDDFHHSAVVRLTGKREGYYADHLGRAQEFISAAKWGFLFQGQYYSWQKAPRGTPFLETEPWRGVTFLENHDQVANTLYGTRPRAHSSARRYRAMAAYWLLGPGTPMFFMGQEYGSTRPFVYFFDQGGKFGESLLCGRMKFLRQFESVQNTPNLEAILAHPADASSFKSCKLVPSDRDCADGVELQRLFHDLLQLRREDPAISKWRRESVDGAVLSNDCFVLRFFLDDPVQGELDRLLVINFGPFLEMTHIPEPLLAPPRGRHWALIWNSEQLEYGGTSAMSPITPTGWRIAEEAAFLLAAAPSS